jgi:hypothetical protein
MSSGTLSSLPTVAESPDSIEALEREITTLSAHLNAGNYRFLRLLAEFDRRGGHVGWGIASCAHWLAWKCGIGLVAARDRVRVARALEHLPLLSDAMRRGVLSYCKIRALTRIATPENEDYLLHTTARRCRPRRCGGCAATARWSRCSSVRMAVFSTWAARPAPYRPRCGARSKPGTRVVAFPAARTAASPTPTTSNTG